MSIVLFGAMKNPGGYATAAFSFYGLGFALFAGRKEYTIFGKGRLVSFGSSTMSLPWKMGISNWVYSDGPRAVLKQWQLLFTQKVHWMKGIKTQQQLHRIADKPGSR